MSRALKEDLLLKKDKEPEVDTLPGGVQIPMSEEMQDTLVQIVMEDYEASKLARDKREYGTTSKGVKLDFERWRKELLDLYNAERIPKTVPWKFCSNRSLRISKAILDMLHARLLPSIVNEFLLKFKAENSASYPKLERIEKLMHWWEFVHSKIQFFFDDWVKVELAFGDSITESSWSAVAIDKGEMDQTPVTGPDGLPVMEEDGTPSMISSQKISLEEKTISKVYTRDKFFLQEGSMDIHRESVVLQDDFIYRDLEEGEMRGQFVNVQSVLKEKLPFAKENHTGLTPEEIEKLKDIKLRNQKVTVYKAYINFDANQDGFPEDIRVFINPDHRVFLGAVALTDITKSGRRPINYTKIESRLENVAENFGYGVLETVKELAEEVDAIFNQMSDANTLAIMPPVFYDPGGDLDAPALQLSPNKMTPVSEPQRNILFPQINIPTDKLILAIRLVLEFIERLTAASSYVLGKESEIVGGSGTATRTNAIVSAANERFAMPAERLRRGAANIIRQHLDLLQLNIPQGLEQRILGDDGTPLFSPNELSQEGISGEFDCYLLPDPSAGSVEAQQQIATMLYQVLMQNPIVASDPTKIYRTSAQWLKAYEQDEKYFLGPAPDTDMIDDPEEENTLILQGDWNRVQAQFQENHMMHIKKHSDLLQSPSLAQLPPGLVQEVVGYTQQHIQQHMMMMEMIQQIMQKTAGGKGGTTNSTGRNAGSQPGQTPGLPPVSGGQGLEQIPGPLGAVLNSKREGQAGLPGGG